MLRFRPQFADRRSAGSNKGCLSMKTSLLRTIPIVALLAGAPTASFASDHADGVKTALDPAADITDLFTFTSPKNPDKLVMVMNVHMLASEKSRFSNAVDYKFRIRPIKDAKTLVPSDDAKSEQSLVCSFSGGVPLVRAQQHAVCTFSSQGKTQTIEFDTRGSSFVEGGASQEENGLRIFAGLRSDPWFVDLSKTVAFNKGKRPERAGGKNGLLGKNVLSIVVEVDKSRLAGPLLAITAQTVRTKGLGS